MDSVNGRLHVHVCLTYPMITGLFPSVRACIYTRMCMCTADHGPAVRPTSLTAEASRWASLHERDYSKSTMTEITEDIACPCIELCAHACFLSVCFDHQLLATRSYHQLQYSYKNNDVDSGGEGWELRQQRRWRLDGSVPIRMYC